MEKTEAFNVVANACAQVPGTLAQHQQIQGALSVLKELVEPKESEDG